MRGLVRLGVLCIAAGVVSCSGDIGSGRGAVDVGARPDGGGPRDVGGFGDLAVEDVRDVGVSPEDTDPPLDVSEGLDVTSDVQTREDMAPADVEEGQDVGADAAASGETLSERHRGDQDLASDPSVLFFDDFETGWGRWESPTHDTQYLTLETDGTRAHAGVGYLRSTVTSADLDNQQYISSSTRFTFPERVDRVYWRFYARFDGVAPNPHHWVRMSAGDADYGSSGLANTVPAGDAGFWFDFDTNNNDVFNFYTYWYKMRSGRCNDGTAVAGCDGDQGTTYFYGNGFQPPGQTRFARDRWFCVEIMGKTNTVGTSDGELAFWIDDTLVEHYRTGNPDGTWLRDKFFTGGCEYSACTEPAPFEGFDFRSSAEVRFKRIFLDAYYERGTFDRKKEYLESLGLTVSDVQTITYDDVVVATERIGCRTAR